MTTLEPTAEQIDAVARAMDPGAFTGRGAALLNEDDRHARQTEARRYAVRILDWAQPDAQAALAANLPREVMLAALVADGTLTECENTALPGWRFYQGEVRP